MDAFLKSHLVTKKTNKPITHTRIGSAENHILGGAYHIPEEDEPILYQLIEKEVIRGNRLEYLTEKQLENGPLYIDLDFRFEPSVCDRQHDFTNWTMPFVDEVLNTTRRYISIDANTPVSIFVMQKDGVNRLSNGTVTKDGIHILFGLNIDNHIKAQIRSDLLVNETILDLFKKLPLTNTLESVFDEGVIKGSTNVQPYGCRKPANDPCKLVYCGTATIDSTDAELS